MKRVVKTGFVALLISVLMMSGHMSEARDSYKRKYPYRHVSRHDNSKIVIIKHGERVFINGRFYRKGRHVFYEVKSPIGATVYSIPKDRIHQIKTPNGVVYKYKSTHYKKAKYGNGFMVVSPPLPTQEGH